MRNFFARIKGISGSAKNAKKKERVPEYERRERCACKPAQSPGAMEGRALSAFFAEPESFYLYATFSFLFFRVKRYFRIFDLCGEKIRRAAARPNGREYRLDLTPPVQRSGPPDSAKNDMRMVLVAPFATKRCLRLKMPVSGGERSRITKFRVGKKRRKNRPACKKTEMMNCGSETPIPKPGYASMTPEPTSSSPSYHAANCPGVMPRWGSSKSR